MALGAIAMLLSVVGDDKSGRRVEQMFDNMERSASSRPDSAIISADRLPAVGLKQQLLCFGFEVEPSRQLLSTRLSELGLQIGSQQVVLVMPGIGRGGLAHVAGII